MKCTPKVLGSLVQKPMTTMTNVQTVLYRLIILLAHVIMCPSLTREELAIDAFEMIILPPGSHYYASILY